MNNRHGFLMSLCFLAAAPALAQPVQVFILAGQSNMVGGNSTPHLPTEPFNYQLPQEGILYSYDVREGQTVFISDGWEALRPSVRGPTYGPEISFGQRINEAVDEPVAILKHAFSGTNLFGDWNPDEPEAWRKVYPEFISHTQRDLALLGTAGVDYEIAGMMWHQGESDMWAPVIDGYGDRLTDFVARVRQDIGAPDMPFYIGAISDLNTNSYVLDLRQHQKDVANALPDVYYVETSQFPLKEDNIHFDPAGSVGLGIAFADAFLIGETVGDFTGEGVVDQRDLNIIVGNWNQSFPADAVNVGDTDGDRFVGQADIQTVIDKMPASLLAHKTTDISGDGFVGIEDLSALLSNWNLAQGYGAPPPASDITSDGFVGIEDLSRLLAEWNTSPVDTRPPEPTFDDLDLDGSGDIDAGDLDVLLASWSFTTQPGPVPPIDPVTDPLPSDFNADGFVDIEDLRYLIPLVPAAPNLNPADLNADGFVGIEDLTRVLAYFNQSVPPGNPEFGDTTGDGFVGIEDLNTVLGNWNAGTPPAASANVPEPATLVLLGLGGLALLRPAVFER
jgi:carbohydrate esterase-like sialic acid-specific acetylesterase/PEP-CTERM motif-containing protein